MKQGWFENVTNRFQGYLGPILFLPVFLLGSYASSVVEPPPPPLLAHQLAAEAMELAG
jgi:hypothetical protein